jgi:Ni/Fe-hydrogenase b-type cytochrome subunit
MSQQAGGTATSSPPRAVSHPADAPTGSYRWVYLWHWPIRAMHWVAGLAIVLLVFTGFFIGRPYYLPAGQMQGDFFIGWMRLIHFIAAGALVATLIVRVYWLFAGNRYERLTALFPVRGSDWVNMWRQIRFYLLIHPERAPRYLGHNPLQQVSYTLVYLVGLVMVLTGFSMYGQANPGGLIRTATIWIPQLLGGIQNVRLIHHVLTWFFLIFIPIHVYLSIRAEILERTGTMSSIVSGGRFVPADEEYIDG